MLVTFERSLVGAFERWWDAGHKELKVSFISVASINFQDLLDIAYGCVNNAKMNSYPTFFVVAGS